MKHSEIPFKTKEMDFPDKWAAFDWMYRKQLGRRNLTEELQEYCRGKMYEARKHTERFKGNQYADKSGCRQNDDNQNVGRTKDVLAKELGISAKSVERAGDFAKGVDAIREISNEAADKVLLH